MVFFRRNVSQRVLYDELAETWWDEAGSLHGLGVLLDPVRVPFVIEALSPNVPGGGRVLDLGTGGGSVAAALDDNGYSIVAVDPSVLSLQAGRAHAGTPAVRFVGGAGEELPFSDGSFDAVVCLEVLEHVDNPGVVIAEASRVLRSGGVFIYSGPNRSVINRVGLLLVAQDLLGLVPRGTHRWRRLLRPSDMERHMRDSDIDPAGIVGVGVRVRSLPRLAGAVMGLLSRRITYPEAARRIDLVAGTSKVVAYQGFGVRR